MTKNSVAKDIEFIEFHQPSLKAGQYKIEVEQTLTANGKIAQNNAFNINKNFYIAGERFAINPTEIDSVFPPDLACGFFDDILPHIVLNRSTSPWERMPNDSDQNPENFSHKTPPWMALLLLDADEYQKIEEKNVRLKDFKSASTTSPFFPRITAEPGQLDETQMSVIDIPKNILASIIPNKEELQLLTHVRQETDGAGNLVEDELASIVSKRLPKIGGTNYVYLISLEDRYLAGKEGDFDFQGAGDNDLIRLVSLKSWSFTANEHYKIIQEFLDNFQIKDSVEVTQALKAKLAPQMTLPAEQREFFNKESFFNFLEKTAKLTTAEITEYRKQLLKSFSFGHFSNLLKVLDKNPSTLRLPKNDNVEAEKYLQMGYNIMPHKMREGSKSASWYHGPLVTSANNKKAPSKITSSDMLLSYDPDNGLFDVSYAAAWQIGRLLTLQNKNISTELFKWKRANRQKISQARQLVEEKSEHFPDPNFHQEDDLNFSDSLKQYFADLKLLKGIPFNYLVSNSKMLPIESIRFFYLDNYWSECLLDGAFSIGRVTEKDGIEDDEAKKAIVAESIAPDNLTGVILRSQVIAGWPGLIIDGYETTPKLGDEREPMDSPIAPFRMERLSANTLICIFDKEVQTVDVHLKPENLHFGLTEKADGSFEKRLRDLEGNEQEAISVQIDSQTRVVDIIDIKNNIPVKYLGGKAITSAALALQMVDGVEKVRFIKK